MKTLKLKTKYGQRDTQWSDNILGFNPKGSKYTIGNYGCLITCLTNYVNSTGHNNETPRTMNEKLKSVNGFVHGSGLLIWNKFLKLFDLSYKFESPRYEMPLIDSNINTMRRYLDNKYMLLCEIDFDPTRNGEQMHWVEIIGYLDGGDFWIHDPWTGDCCKLSHYGDIRKAIYHYKVFSRKLLSDRSDNKDTDSERIKVLESNLENKIDELNAMRSSRDKWKAKYKELVVKCDDEAIKEERKGVSAMDKGVKGTSDYVNDVVKYAAPSAGVGLSLSEILTQMFPSLEPVQAAVAVVSMFAVNTLMVILKSKGIIYKK